MPPAQTSEQANLAALEEPLPPLENGDHLDQPTFHERYLAMPEHVRAELIEGVVHMASPVSHRHSASQFHLDGWLWLYAAETPGTSGHTTPTIVLGPRQEPQPDLCLRILPPHGACRVEGTFLHGAPEFVAEIAYSTEALDLFEKKGQYERFAVREYVVIALRQAQVFWFVRDAEGGFQEHPSDAQGVFRSRVLPGLWLDSAALFRSDATALIRTLNAGLASPEHAAFVQSLASPATKI